MHLKLDTNETIIKFRMLALIHTKKDSIKTNKTFSMKTIILFFLAVGIFTFSCTNNPGSKNTAENASKVFELKEIWRTDTVLKTPESVLYDETRDVLYVSNINSNPAEKDLNGFISLLSSDGEVTSLEWVTGLSAPKGMGVFSNLLYVADVTDLVIIDIDEAKIIQKIPVDSSVFLNDITVDASGKVYISDSRTGKIHIFENGQVSEWISGLSNPNGLYAEESRILLATSSFNSVDPTTGAVTMLADSIGHGDGIEFTGMAGYYMVSDWTGEVFLIYPDNSKTSVLQTRDQKKNTADIGFIQETKVLLVPTFFGNQVVAYELTEKD